MTRSPSRGRILHLISNYQNGGLGTFTSNLSRVMAESGWQSTAYFYCNQPDPSRNHIGPWLRTIWNDHGSLGALLANERFDLLMSNIRDFSSVMRVVRRVGGPMLVIGRCGGTSGRFVIPRGVHGVIANSEASRSIVECQAPCEIRVVLNGVDLEMFFPNKTSKRPERRVLLWVGRSGDAAKNLSGFLTLLSHFNPDQYEFWTVDGRPDSDIESIEQWTGWPIRTLSGLSPQEMCELYRQVAASSGCLVVTSRTEGLPSVVLEAMACGCPVVASAVGGIPEVITSGHDGLLFDLSDGAGKCAEAVRTVTEGPSRERIVAQGLKTVKERFSLMRAAEQYMQLYSELLEQRRLRKRRVGSRVKRCAWGTLYRWRERFRRLDSDVHR